jgi:hypothetical protein
LTHKVRLILFSLVVDAFGVKTVGQEHANHLISALQDLYTLTADWGGTKYLGLQLKWDYIQRTSDISMPDYVATALHRFQHPFPKNPSTHHMLGSNPTMVPLFSYLHLLTQLPSSHLKVSRAPNKLVAHSFIRPLRLTQPCLWPWALPVLRNRKALKKPPKPS